MQHLALYQTATRRIIGVLQQWQVLLSSSYGTVTEVTLADVEAITTDLQETFGASAPLEAIIQRLVAHDLREQLSQPHQEPTDLACPYALQKAGAMPAHRVRV